MDELTEDDVFNNDVDPLDGIREARKAMEASGEKQVEEEEELPEKTDAEEEPKDEEDPKPEIKEEEESENLDPSEPENTNTGEEQEGDDEEGESKPLTSAELSEVRKYKANGQEYEFTVKEILDQFGVVFGKSVDYTQKTQKIAPYRKMISALEQEEITHEQLNVAIDALKGDKGAIKQLIDSHGIDSYDLSEEQAYTPNSYGSDELTLNLQETVDRINKDPEYATTSQVVQNWDRNSQSSFANNPHFLEGLHNDIKTGLYAKLAPAVAKMKVLDGNTKSDLEYYMLAGQQYRAQQEKAEQATSNVEALNAKSKAVIEESDKASSEASKKRLASNTSTRIDKSVTNYLDDDDEKFDEWYKNLIKSN